MSEAEEERRMARAFKIGGGIILVLVGFWILRTFPLCALSGLLVPVLLAWLWDYNDTHKEEERGRRILSAGGDRAAVQAELARYHSDETRTVQTRYGLYEISAFDSRLGKNPPEEK